MATSSARPIIAESGAAPSGRTARTDLGPRQHRLEPLAPGLAERIDRHRRERLRPARQHRVQLGPARDQGFGDDDVRSGRERAEAEADILLLEHRRDLLVEMLAAHDLRVERHVPAEMERAGRAVGVEPGGIPVLRVEDEGELAERGGVVLPRARREGDRFGEGGAGFVVAVEEEQGLGASGGAVIGVSGSLGSLSTCANTSCARARAPSGSEASNESVAALIDA